MEPRSDADVKYGFSDLANLSDLIRVAIAGTIWLPASDAAEA
jgi:hypothetical protein